MILSQFVVFNLQQLWKVRFCKLATGVKNLHNYVDYILHMHILRPPFVRSSNTKQNKTAFIGILVLGVKWWSWFKSRIIASGLCKMQWCHFLAVCVVWTGWHSMMRLYKLDICILNFIGQQSKGPCGRSLLCWHSILWLSQANFNLSICVLQSYMLAFEERFVH